MRRKGLNVDIRNTIIEEAKKHLGTPYDKMDCSKLVQVVMKKLGDKDFPRVSATQAEYVVDLGLAKTISKSEGVEEIKKKLQVGDLVWWANKKYDWRYMEIHHIEIYAGDGKTVGSTGSGNGVHIGNLWETEGWQIVLIADITALISLGKEEDMLEYGDTGEQVYRAQTKLRELGYEFGDFLDMYDGKTKNGLDGSFGPVTREQVEKAQKDLGVITSNIGCVDIPTLDAIDKAYYTLTSVDAEELAKVKAENAKLRSTMEVIRDEVSKVA